MCSTKQSKLASNRLSVERIKSVFGEDGMRVPGMLPNDFNWLLEFASNGITPIVADDFQPQRQDIPPLRARYEKVKHTVNSLLFEQFKNDTVIIMKTELAQTIDDSIKQTPRVSQRDALLGTCQANMSHHIHL